MIQYNNFLMKREQSRAGSRFAECEKSRLKAKILITLALLLTAVTGAWADGTLLTTITAADNSSFKSGSQTFGDVATVTLTGDYLRNDGSHGGWYCLGSNLTATISVAAANGANITSVKFYTAGGGSAEDKDAPFEVTTTTVTSSNITTYLNGNSIGSYGVSKIEVFGPAEAPITVEWNASTKTGTFSMPGSDVVLTPQYAPAAQLAENGAPAAVSGLEIAADAAIITAGQSAQGTLLYAVGTSETEKPALTAFAATLPNAKDQTAAGNYYVWYYIQGQDTPQGQEPSAENTFNDSEIMGPVKVELLTNEHTLNIKQSPNITVTVAGTAVTPTDDKVTPVTTGQEVKIKAKEGYKFRKVEVKKGAAEKPVTLATALEDGATLEVMCQSSQSGNGLQMGGNFTNNNGEFTRNNFVGTSNVFSVMKATATISGTTITFATGFTTNDNYDHNVTLNTTDNTYTLTGGSNKGSVVSVKVNGVEILDKLSELK